MEQNRRNWLLKIGFTFAGIGLAKFKTFASPAQDFLNKSTESLQNQSTNIEDNMKLGAFSVSLNVKDINASKQFYENLGFKVFAGDLKKNYLIMKNENSLVGLFYGMFEKTILTFNPGWDENAHKVEKFEDVREIQRNLKSKGIKLMTETDENSSGPAGVMLVDPDGNQILIDQHV
jgi:lactoylglutathione lyase